jgi:hypothetical protein
MVGITNIFSQAGSLILNNFDKYQYLFFLFLVRPIVNNLNFVQHKYDILHVLCITQWAFFLFPILQISNVDSYGKMLNLVVLTAITFFGWFN